MTRSPLLALALSLPLPWLPVSPGAQPTPHGDGTETQEVQEYDFEALARDTAEVLGVPADAEFDEVLQGAGFVRAELGAFDVYLPVASLRSGPELERLREACLACLDTQAVWWEWRAPDAESAKARAKDWKTARKWVDGWGVSGFSGVEGGAEPLGAQLAVKDKTREALARLRELTKSPADTVAALGERNRLVLTATRESFLRTAALGGLLDQASRPTLWRRQVLTQTAAWVGWTQVVSLVSSAYPLDVKNPFDFTLLTKDQPTGFVQHVADRCATHLLRKEFYRHGTHFFEEALGTELVIAVAGRNDQRQGDWKIEYHTPGARTEPYSRFVPGGNPAGGVLPARKAVAGPAVGSAVDLSRYRIDGGPDFFLKALKAGQKAGAKLASKNREDPLRKNKAVHFELHSFDPVGDTYVTAPFLGQPAEGKALPPNDFLDDYEDFFRAYRACFFHWLREHGAGSTADSEARFAELIAKHAARQVGTPMDAVVEAVYGVPLSSPSPETDALEWRFLDWLK